MMVASSSEEKDYHDDDHEHRDHHDHQGHHDHEGQQQYCEAAKNKARKNILDMVREDVHQFSDVSRFWSSDI